MQLPPLSSRLKSCYHLVHQGDRVADIGCDHGYLGITLLLNGVARSVIAADVNAQPLASARQNAARFGVEDQMTFRLSDGVQNIPRDFDTLVCAGMGADTMISILEAAPWLKSKQYRLILQCQSKRPELRKYLYRQGYAINKETLAEDGKFIYTVMEVIYDPQAVIAEKDYYISPALLNSNSPLLSEFYNRVMDGLAITVEGLSHKGGEKYEYYLQLQKELNELEGMIHDHRS